MVIIVVSKKQKGVIQDLHREVWSLSGDLWPGDSIVITWTFEKFGDQYMPHNGWIKIPYLTSSLLFIQAFCYKFKKKTMGSHSRIFLCKNVKLEKFNGQNLCKE